MSVKRPLLRYFGGKWQLRYWIVSHFPEHQFYAEPFAGAASVLLSKKPAPGGEIINDLNRDIINLFRVMQSAELSLQLRRRLAWTPYSAAELALAREPSDEPVEKARRMLVRSFMGIEVAGVRGTNSGFRMGNVDLNRLDKAGKRTFRNCAKDWFNWKQAMPAIRDRLAEVMIYEKDAIEFMGQMDSADCLLYVDPPYVHSERAGTRYAVEFVAHEALTQRLLTMKAKVVLSGYESDVHRPLVDAGWRKVSKDYRANMSAARRTECLWISPSAQMGMAL